MNDDEFQEFIDSCFEELEEKQERLISEFGFGSFDKFQHDFEKEEIYLLKDGQVRVKAKLIPIGSFNTKSSTWMWGWANEAFPAPLRKKAEKLKQLEALTGFEMFGNEVAEIDPDMAWEIAGMALNLLGSEGAYRGPAGSTQYFYALEQVDNVYS
ncbi:hypothetical protein QQF73_19195 [Marinobacter sp. M216]|uniref:Phage protein n=1 Tax=Marinobacter albus TaxID=3030833 RepID=A0ABT7HJT0_9GAMM|nr:DUF6882 domain-containing protein [Marinobacter sp. M216]MDK9559765.1 hypothetical protein [Marinobacter sp. M216]